MNVQDIAGRYRRDRASNGATRVIAAMLALGSLALAIEPASSQNVNREAKLTIGWAEPPDSLNPATTGARNVGPIIGNIFDTLGWLTPDVNGSPQLATKRS